MAEIFLNRVWATLAAGMNDSQTTMPLVATHGARFGSIGAGDKIRVAMLDAALNVSEVVYVTAIVGDTLTIVRGQDGTVAVSHLLGDRIEARVGKSTMDTFSQKAKSGTDAIAETYAAAEKATLDGADIIPIGDSAAVYGLKNITWTSLKLLIHKMTTQATVKATVVDADEFQISDSVAGFVIKKTSWANLKATFLATSNYFTGVLQVKVLTETKTAPAISGTTLTLDLSQGCIFEVALNAAITVLNITNPPASGTPIGFTLVFTADGTARSVTWAPANIKWVGGVAPTLTSTNGKKDYFTFYTSDNGATYQAFVSGQNG